VFSQDKSTDPAKKDASAFTTREATDLTLAEAQLVVDHWIKTIGVRYFSELTNLAILTEEVGELARIISRKYGEQSFKKGEDANNLGDEMADVLWVLICLANQTGIDLTDAFRKNLDKKTKRDAVRHLENEKLID
jgi:NTP pyrophosphatase (non-canonical NTP hydrolase)